MYWGLFDPMVYSVLNLVGGAFCVWLLYYQGDLKSEYGWSFIFTEIALFSGLILTRFLPELQVLGKNNYEFVIPPKSTISEFDVFTFVVGSVYIILELISILTVGIVILDTQENHASAFNDHGILRAFISSYRTLMICALFYKKRILRQNWNIFHIVCFVFLLFGVLTSGSKGSVLTFVFIYYILSFPLMRLGLTKKIKISIPLLVTLASFPIIVIMIRVGANPTSAIQQVYVRLLASGDVFLLGYHENVMSSLTETSFIRYAFYPGWGSVLKNLGFEIKAPRLIGSDIFEFYTNALSGGGPNARHNYLGYHFFGFYGSILYSFIIGLIIGIVRRIFEAVHPYKMSYFLYLFAVISAYIIPAMIDDLNIFANGIFWTLLFLSVSYLLTKFVYTILQALSFSSKSQELA